MFITGAMHFGIQYFKDVKHCVILNSTYGISAERKVENNYIYCQVPPVVNPNSIEDGTYVHGGSDNITVDHNFVRDWYYIGIHVQARTSATSANVHDNVVAVVWDGGQNGSGVPLLVESSGGATYSLSNNICEAPNAQCPVPSRWFSLL